MLDDYKNRWSVTNHPKWVDESGRAWEVEAMDPAQRQVVLGKLRRNASQSYRTYLEGMLFEGRHPVVKDSVDEYFAYLTTGLIPGLALDDAQFEIAARVWVEQSPLVRLLKQHVARDQHAKELKMKGIVDG